MNLEKKSVKPPAKKPHESLTPLMLQYQRLRSEHPGEIILFRLGDFYELFGDDAIKAAPLLEVALTQRQGIPMCGIPFHALDRYLSKLLKSNLRVAIAEQMEDPATVKGIVKRDVVRVISPGTIIEENLLNEKSNNFLVSLAVKEKTTGNPPVSIGIAILDISTGEFTVTEIEDGENFSNLESEFSRINPAEALISNESDRSIPFLKNIPTQSLDKQDYQDLDLSQFFNSNHPNGTTDLFGNHPLPAQAAKMMLAAVKKMNPTSSFQVHPPRWMTLSENMTLDRETIENLEIVKNNEDGSKEMTLLHFLDRTLTAMGGRLLKQWLVRPLTNIRRVQERLDAVKFFIQHLSVRSASRAAFKGVSDLERIMIRILSGQPNPRDVLGLKTSLQNSVTVRDCLNSKHDSPLSPLLHKLASSIEDCTDLISLIEKSIAEDPPIYLEETGVIREGYDPLLDEKRKAAQEGKQWLHHLEIKAREATRIPTLKVGYTSVFGYYLEVTKPHLSKVPPSWHRKQTLVNNERFVNEELKELEQKILGAEEQCVRIEKQIFKNILESVKTQTGKIQKIAKAVARLDCFLSLAEVAETQGLVQPEMNESETLEITEGWHPIVKESLPSGTFVSNDLKLDRTTDQIIILTGPNMSGKSTYLRQTALIVLMAQIGSYVPAKSAQIGVIDRIFTRIGSGDRLAQGASTFMVEMQETAKILSQVTSKSLVILDEVGRGTSTYDGISIAWAVIEHLAQIQKPKVLFATHYFELTHLAGKIDGVKNYNVQAKEWRDSVLFLHKIAPGPADRSYGIHVAQLAGLPPQVVQKAKIILDRLENEHQSLLQLKEGVRQELLNL